MASRDTIGIKYALLNIQSAMNKTHEIRDLVKEEGYDILMLTETWLGEYDKAKINEMTPLPCILSCIVIEKTGGEGESGSCCPIHSER